jgi:tripartite-type tricarboxylate transporter receptor subunit TctC
MEKRMSSRLVLLFFALAAGINLGWSNRAVAESSTACTIKLVVNFAPGGGTDVVARVFAQGFAKQLGQQVVVENVPGGGAMLGTSRVAKSAPDGCTIAFGGTSDAVNQSLYQRPLYDLLADFVPVALVAMQPSVLIAKKDFPANNLQEFIAYARAHQASLTFGAAVGSSGHLLCAQFNGAIGVKTTLIPYRGGSAAMPDIISGRIDYLCTLNASAKAAIDQNLVKTIASFSVKRSPFLPNVPTADEQGLSNVGAPTWFGLLLPKGTPADIVDRLRSALVATLDDEQVQLGMGRVGAEVVPSEQRSGSYFVQFLVDDVKNNAEILKTAGVDPQ